MIPKDLEILTALGGHIIPLWWVNADGSCGCTGICGGGNNIGKHPMGGLRWYEEATTDVRKIEGWLAKWPNCNWGTLTGVRSGYFVVDIDPKNGGPESWAKLIAEHGQLPPTLEVRTGSGGTHYYFRMPALGDPIRTRVGIREGVDIKGEGNSQVVVPPSLHRSGGRYEWVVAPGQGTPLADAPEWLVGLARARTPEKDLPGLDGVAKLGTRDDALFHNALRMLRQGEAPEEVQQKLLEWVEKGGVEQTPQDPITPSYVINKVKAAQAYLKANPPKLTLQAVKTMWSEVANRDLLVETLTPVLLHVPGFPWATWQGTHWLRCDDETIHYIVSDAMIQALTGIATAFKLDEKTRQKLEKDLITLAHIKVNTEWLAFDPRLQKTAEEFDRNEWLMNFPNGTLDLRTGELGSHNKEHLITKLLSYDYDPDADCPTWASTLSYAFGTDQELLSYFHRSLGYSITGHMGEQCFWTMWGVGQNGKGSLINGAIDALEEYGDHAGSSVIDSYKGGSAAGSTLARLQGKRLVAITEASVQLNTELVKAITGEDPIDAKFLYQNSFSYRPQFKLWLTANTKPAIKDVDYAMWRRVKLIPFKYRIPDNEKKSVRELLRTERQGIMAWLIRGCLSWQEKGLQEPEEVKQAIQDYRDESDLVLQCLEERCLFEFGAETSVRDLYNVYKDWAKGNGIRSVMSAQKFRARLGGIASIAVSENLSGQNTYTVSGLKPFRNETKSGEISNSRLS